MLSGQWCAPGRKARFIWQQAQHRPGVAGEHVHDCDGQHVLRRGARPAVRAAHAKRSWTGPVCVVWSCILLQTGALALNVSSRARGCDLGLPSIRAAWLAHGCKHNTTKSNHHVPKDVSVPDRSSGSKAAWSGPKSGAVERAKHGKPRFSWSRIRGSCSRGSVTPPDAVAAMFGSSERTTRAARHGEPRQRHKQLRYAVRVCILARRTRRTPGTRQTQQVCTWPLAGDRAMNHRPPFMSLWTHVAQQRPRSLEGHALGPRSRFSGCCGVCTAYEYGGVTVLLS